MHVVIVGGGLAGVTAARTIRENDPRSEISIYTEEPHPYYPRPRLYEILAGEANPQDIYMFSDSWYSERRISVHLRKQVVGVEADRKTLLLADGSRVSYDKLLLAIGAHPFVPPIKGTEKTGVFTLRSMRDVLAIREHAQKTRKAIVIGGGVLGLEFAASLRKLGLQVDVVEIFPRLLPRQLDHDGAGVLKDRIASLGIDIYLGSKTEEILGSKTVSGIRLDTGKELTGNLVLISAGVRSNIDLAASSGIHVKRGVIVDHRLQTNVPDVYAAGDTAEFEGRTYGIIPAAMEQAKIAAWNMVTKNQQVYTGTIPSNTLKIVGIDLASLGLVNPEDPRYVEIQKIDKEKGVYKKIVLENGKIVGAILLGARKGVTAIKEMIERETDVTKHKDSILDDDFDLRRVRP